MRVEILRSAKGAAVAEPMLRAIGRAAADAGDQVIQTKKFAGESDALVLYGVGALPHDRARCQQLAHGHHALLWDLGYFRSAKAAGFLRCSVDHDHPHRMFDRTEPDPSRLDAQGVALREGFDPAGPVLLVGLGHKSRRYLHDSDWEARALNILRKRFPKRQVLHRPKPGQDFTPLHCERDATTPIEELLPRCSLVVCRHSNVAIDAAIAGVPFECEDGAALWLARREFTPDNRLDFLRRLAWWQWSPAEAGAAWAFLKGFVS